MVAPWLDPPELSPTNEPAPSFMPYRPNIPEVGPVIGTSILAATCAPDLALFQILTSSVTPWKNPLGVRVALVFKEVPTEVITAVAELATRFTVSEPSFTPSR